MSKMDSQWQVFILAVRHALLQKGRDSNAVLKVDDRRHKLSAMTAPPRGSDPPPYYAATFDDDLLLSAHPDHLASRFIDAWEEQCKADEARDGA